MSGSMSTNVVKSRKDYQIFVDEYLAVLCELKDFVVSQHCGSYCHNLHKNTFGDIDLITHFYSSSKQEVKDSFKEFIKNKPEHFLKSNNPKHKEKLLYSYGDSISVHFYSKILGYSCQIDSNIVLSEKELIHKFNFLSMEACHQSSLVAFLRVLLLTPNETPENLLESVLSGLKHIPVSRDTELILSIKDFTIVDVKYDNNFKTKEKIVKASYLKEDFNWFGLRNISTDKILEYVKTNFSQRQKTRFKSLIKSMLTVKTGEQNTEKAKNKLDFLNKINNICSIESRL